MPAGDEGLSAQPPATRLARVVLDRDAPAGPATADAPAVQTLLSGLRRRFDDVAVCDVPLTALAACLRQRPSAVVLVQRGNEPPPWHRPFRDVLRRSHATAIWVYATDEQGRSGQLARIDSGAAGAAAGAPTRHNGQSHGNGQAPAPSAHDAPRKQTDHDHTPDHDPETQSVQPATQHNEQHANDVHSLAIHMDDAGSPLDGPLISEEELALLLGSGSDEPRT